MRGFVLAAGFGKRLQPITLEIPKALLPLGALPLIAYALKLLSHYGIQDVGMNTHHLADQLRIAVGDGSRFGTCVTYSHEDEILGTGGGIQKMASFLSQDTCVVVNSDTVVDVDVHALLAKHRTSGAMATMLLREDTNVEEGGRIGVDAHGRVCSILEHSLKDPLRRLMFAGVHVFEPAFFQYLVRAGAFCVIREAYVPALLAGAHIESMITKGYFADAGTPERFWSAHEDAVTGRMKLSYADPRVYPTNRAGVCLAPDAKLEREVQLLGPSVVGSGAILETGSRVGPLTTLAEGVQVGAGAVVAKSVVLAGVKIAAGSVHTRSMVGKKSVLRLC